MPEFEPHLVLADSYDRDAFERAVRGIPQVEKLRESGGRLLPHFEPLLEDLFACLFKLVVRLRPEEQSPVSSHLNRRALRAVLGSPGFAALKEETALDAARAAEGAIGLAERVLALVRSGELLTEEELLDALTLAQAEGELDRDRRAVEATKPSGAPIARFLEQKVVREEQRTGELARRLQQTLAEMPPTFDAALSRKAESLAAELPESGEAARSFSQGLLGRAPRDSSESLRLAEQLRGSEKVRKLAALAGAFRAEALAARRKRRERAPTEVYTVGLGADLGHLLPSELLSLRHAVRRKDFLRRYLEARLSQYGLRGDDRQGRGPLVVCLDGSGSMAGERELWAKAVALALLEIARRQGRRARAIVFSGAEAELKPFDLISARGRKGGRKQVELSQVLAFADCFPGGGTDFQKPLAAAQRAVEEAGLKGADIVFVTDGEAELSPDFVERFNRERAARGTAVYSVVVDEQAPRNRLAGQRGRERAIETLSKVSDRVTSVSKLSAGAVKGLFEDL